jgi:hypothetical protein
MAVHGIDQIIGGCAHTEHVKGISFLQGHGYLPG